MGAKGQPVLSGGDVASHSAAHFATGSACSSIITLSTHSHNRMSLSKPKPNTEPRDLRKPPLYTKRHWAKSDRQNPKRIHLLEHHLADVGACFEVLAAQPTIRLRLAMAGNRHELDNVTSARLAVFAALHDIGKVNIGFQTRIWREEDLQGRRRPRWAGHTSDLIPVMKGTDTETSSWFWGALGWDDFCAWDRDDGETASALFTAAMSHHGAPLDLHASKEANPAIWRPFADLEPEQVIRRIGRLVREWFPLAFSVETPTLPSAPSFQHMFLGLCTLADWIGSDEQFFKYCSDLTDDYIDTARLRAKKAVVVKGLDIKNQRAVFPPLPDFQHLFEIDGDPKPVQKSASTTSLDSHLAIIESETGSGKTEAALWRFAYMYEAGLVDGIYFALPTRAAASQMHKRVTRFVSQMFPAEHRPAPVLAVPGYVRAGDFTGKHLPNYKVWWEDSPGSDVQQLRWAAESAKRFLAAQVAVGTVDQAMMAALQVRHSHMRAACLARNLLVVDEVHASDPYMRVILGALINIHLGAGGHALLMSATLGSVARSRWLSTSRDSEELSVSLEDAIAAAYPAITLPEGSGEPIQVSGNRGPQKEVWIETRPAMRDFSWVARRALSAARYGARVLVVRNTVDHAVKTQRALEEASNPSDTGSLFSCRNVPTLHTGRFVAEDRELLDKEVEARLGKNRVGGGAVVVGTQTLEQSLDIDADLLITDLCPMDVLLQRIGRLHRHPVRSRPTRYEKPTCIVLTPPGEDLSALLTKKGNTNGLGPGGFVYPDLTVLEATRRLIVEAASGKPWRIPDRNRELVERTTHRDALNMIGEEMGEEWRVHANEVEGVEIADNLTARHVVTKHDLSFLNRDVRFAGDEEKIRTRLGDEAVEMELTEPQPSPFKTGTLIPRVAVPRHMLSATVPDEPVSPSTGENGFDFSVADLHFRYDRLGLRKVEL